MKLQKLGSSITQTLQENDFIVFNYNHLPRYSFFIDSTTWIQLIGLASASLNL